MLHLAVLGEFYIQLKLVYRHFLLKHQSVYFDLGYQGQEFYRSRLFQNQYLQAIYEFYKFVFRNRLIFYSI